MLAAAAKKVRSVTDGEEWLIFEGAIDQGVDDIPGLISLFSLSRPQVC
jgi:hypothetical protein